MNATRGAVRLSKPVLLIGGGGMLGRAWRQLLDQRRIPHDAPPRQTLDLTQSQTIQHHVTDRYGVVVNCAGYTDVDAAESDLENAYRVNGQAVEDLMRRCLAASVTLVHYSTDYVFEGKDQPISTDTSRRPINGYGRSKALGEELIDKLDPGRQHHLLVRTSWLYAPWGKNFVRTIATSARQRPMLRVVGDQRGRPTSSKHLAAASLALLEHGAKGQYHITDGGECTWYEFALDIARQVNPHCRVEPCTSGDYPRPARRPTYSVLDLSKTEQLLGPMPHWRDNLANVIRQLEARP